MGRKGRSQPSKRSGGGGGNFNIDSGLLKSDSGLGKEFVRCIIESQIMVEDDKAENNKQERTTIEDVVEESTKSRKECDECQKKKRDTDKVNSEFELQKDKREAVAVFKHKRHGIDKGLMDQVRQRFPTKFPEECQVLIDSVKARKQLKWLCKPRNIDKFLDLMKSAHYLSSNGIPAEDFKNLMMMTYKSFPHEFPCREFRISMKMESEKASDFRSKNCAKTEKNLRTLSNSIRNLVLSKDLREKLASSKDLCENLVGLIILTRCMFPRYLPPVVFNELLKEARIFFPGEFPPEPSSDTFTDTVAILEKRESSVKDKKVLMIIEGMLLCMLNVATNTKWSQKWGVDTRGLSDADYGKQFFHLCKGVARSNRVFFHKEPVLEEVEANAREGEYRVGDHDVGSAVVGCLKSRTPR